MTLVDIKDGQTFKVKRVTLSKEIGKRLADMGFVEGAEGVVVRRAPLGDALQVSICYYNVSLRHSEAAGIEVLWVR